MLSFFSIHRKLQERKSKESSQNYVISMLQDQNTSPSSLDSSLYPIPGHSYAYCFIKNVNVYPQLDWAAPQEVIVRVPYLQRMLDWNKPEKELIPIS